MPSDVPFFHIDVDDEAESCHSSMKKKCRKSVKKTKSVDPKEHFAIERSLFLILN